MSNRADSYIGRYVGTYRITREIACGSFGCVYMAQHTYLPRTAAIKILHEAHITSTENREHFLQEARFLERLKHPHIVPIYDFGMDDGLPYLVTEYAPGGSLQDLLKRESRTPLQVKEAVTILSQIGNALDYAHQQNIIHHDLKPANILFNGNGEALLADFGIAIMQGDTKSRQATTVDGALAYMAPERFEGTVSKRSDQYALGCIAYEMLTGRTPFIASPDDIWVIWAHKHKVEDPPALTQFNPTIPEAVEQVVLKALAKHPQERYADLATFVAALQIAIIRSLEEDTPYPVVWYKKQLEEYEQVLRTESLSEQDKSLDKGAPLAEIVECLTKPYMEKSLAHLSWIERSCLLLHINAQFTPNEIAEIMGIGEQEVCEAIEQGRERILRTYYLYLEQEQILPQGELRTPTKSDDARIASLLKRVLTIEPEQSAQLIPGVESEQSVQQVSRERKQDNDADLEGTLAEYHHYIVDLVEHMARRNSNLVRPEVFDLEIDEIVQRVRIKLWYALKEKSIKYLKAYIRTIVRNECNDLSRERKSLLPSLTHDDAERRTGEVMTNESQGMADPADEFEESESLREWLNSAVAAYRAGYSHKRQRHPPSRPPAPR